MLSRRLIAEDARLEEAFKGQMTLLVIVKDQYSLGVSQHTHKITNVHNNWAQLVIEVYKRIAKEKHNWCQICLLSDT